jgi:LacI family transcriptional regulator
MWRDLKRLQCGVASVLCALHALSFRASKRSDKAKSRMPRSTSKPTLHDVAATAGVSIATASRALNGLLVSKGSQERVASAARKLGYVANETARALRSERSQTLGLVFHALGNARGLQLLDALSAKLDASGYSLLIATARGDEPTYDLLIRRFLQRRVDGLFCVSPDGDSASAAICTAGAVPVMALRSRGVAYAMLPLLQPSFEKAARAATEELRALGHRRVAFIDDGNELDPASPVMTAWADSPFQIDYIQLSAVKGIDQLIRQIMRRADRPTVIAGSESLAETALAVCRSAGISVPGELSIVAVTNSDDDARAKRIGLSSMLIDSHLFGEQAGSAMLAWLDGHKPKNRTAVEIGKWQARATTGTAPPRTQR